MSRPFRACECWMPRKPRALPWAGMPRPFGAGMSCLCITPLACPRADTTTGFRLPDLGRVLRGFPGSGLDTFSSDCLHPGRTAPTPVPTRLRRVGTGAGTASPHLPATLAAIVILKHLSILQCGTTRVLGCRENNGADPGRITGLALVCPQCRSKTPARPAFSPGSVNPGNAGLRTRPTCESRAL